MTPPRPSPENAWEIPWRALADGEFAAQALPVVETMLAQEPIERRLLVLLDDELHHRLALQRARRRRRGRRAPAAEIDLRPLCYLLLMAFDRVCEDGKGGATLVARGLRLAGLHALFCLLAGEPIAAPAWALAHRMYLRAERSGDAMLITDIGASSDTLYLRMLLLSTIADLGMTPRQTDKCFDWLQAWARGIALEREYDAARQYLAVDLAGSDGLVPAATPRLASPRYFAHGLLAERVSASRADYFRHISVTTLGLYAANPLFEYLDALHQLSRFWDYVNVRQAGKDSGRRPVDGVPVAAEAGFAACCEALRSGKASMRWELIDQSPTGAGFRAKGRACSVEKDALTVFVDPESGGWVLGAAVRVVPTERGADIGVKRLADGWRMVELAEEAVEHRAPNRPAIAGFFIFGDEARGLSDSVLLRSGTFDPSRNYTIRPGRDLFRIRLSRVIQSAGDWEQIGFDVLKRLKTEA